MGQNFSKAELSEMEALEVRGGKSSGLMAQGGCTNYAAYCGSGVDQSQCVNKAASCGSTEIKPDPGTQTLV